jgi:hypothetical protein
MMVLSNTSPYTIRRALHKQEGGPPYSGLWTFFTVPLLRQLAVFDQSSYSNRFPANPKGL